MTFAQLQISCIDADAKVIREAIHRSSTIFVPLARDTHRHICLPAPLFEAKFEKYRFASRSARTITTLAAFRRDLEGVRQRGYATSDREEYDYICGMAAPIFNYVGEVIASINVWGTTEETSLQELEQHVGRLMAVTQEVTDLIGGTRDAAWMNPPQVCNSGSCRPFRTLAPGMADRRADPRAEGQSRTVWGLIAGYARPVD